MKAELEIKEFLKATNEFTLYVAKTRPISQRSQRLIAKGADVNAKIEAGKSKGQTPLDLAVSEKHPETADLLRKHGGKTDEELKAEGK